MSDLDVVDVAEALSVDLGLPYAVVRWRCPLYACASPSPGLRRALASHAISCADGLAIAVVLAPIRRPLVRGELAAVSGASLLALHPEAVSWLDHRFRPGALAAVDEDCLQHERVLLAAGAATLHEDEVVPTVAGLVAFGREAASLLGGLHAIVEGEHIERVLGDPIALPQSIARVLGLSDAAAEVLRLIVLHALISRSWLPHAGDAPIEVTTDGRRLEVRWLSGGSNSHRRALEFAVEQQACGKVEHPAVLGAYITVGRCFDLTDNETTALLAGFYENHRLAREEAGLPLHTNRPGRGGSHDLLLRDLDCAVLNFGLANLDAEAGGGGPFYQTVRGVFVEGDEAYPGAAIRTKTHVQIAVRDTSCIVGFFLPSGYTDEEEAR